LYVREILLVAALLVAVGCAFYYAAKFRRAEQTVVKTPPVAGWTPELQQLWAPILNSSRPLMICLSTPSAGVTGVGAAHGAFLLGEFLGQRKQDIQLTPSDQLSMPELAMGNVVFLGPATGSRQTRAIPGDRQIVLEPEGIRNLKPLPGEPALLLDRAPQNPQGIAESYALISHVPGLNGNGEILYFSGNQTPAVMGAVQAFTDPASARNLVSKLDVPGGRLPRYYQVVLKVTSMDEMPLEVSYVFHRELAPVGP
jgi:hypothetical protein